MRKHSTILWKIFGIFHCSPMISFFAFLTRDSPPFNRITICLIMRSVTAYSLGKPPVLQEKIFCSYVNKISVCAFKRKHNVRLLSSFMKTLSALFENIFALLFQLLSVFMRSRFQKKLCYSRGQLFIIILLYGNLINFSKKSLCF